MNASVDCMSMLIVDLIEAYHLSPTIAPFQTFAVNVCVFVCNEKEEEEKKR